MTVSGPGRLRTQLSIILRPCCIRERTFVENARSSGVSVDLYVIFARLGVLFSRECGCDITCLCVGLVCFS